MSTNEIALLRAQVEQLTARLDALQPKDEPTRSEALTDPAAPPAAVPVNTTVSRRQWVRGATAAAVGGTAALVAGGRPVAAATGDALTLGENNTAAARTRSDYTGSGIGVGHLFQSGDVYNVASAVFPAALGGYTTKANQRNGIYGYTAVEDARACGVVGFAEGILSAGVRGRADSGVGLRGEGKYGLEASGNLAAVNLVPSSIAYPDQTTTFHEGGELYVRAASDSGLAIELWFCTVGGTPGTWTQIAGPNLPGQFHAITPTRAYDSRRPVPAPGVLSGGANRIVDISLGRNLETGASTGTIVPAGAGAIAFNLAVTETTGGGFLGVAPSYATEVTAATINWSAAGQDLNNGSITLIGNDRKVKVFAGGGSTHFVLDITGYWI